MYFEILTIFDGSLVYVHSPPFSHFKPYVMLQCMGTSEQQVQFKYGAWLIHTGIQLPSDDSAGPKYHDLLWIISKYLDYCKERSLMQ